MDSSFPNDPAERQRRAVENLFRVPYVTTFDITTPLFD